LVGFADILQSSEVSLPERFGRRQGYAFITFENEEDVDRAVSDINGKELLGREMRVQKATSGGPYATENGDADGKTSAESKKARQRPRSRVRTPNAPHNLNGEAEFPETRPNTS